VVLGAGRFGSAQPAFVRAGAEALDVGASNPLPQALVLTAIVIGFSLTCFSLALVLALQQRFRTTDVAGLDAAEPAMQPDGLPAVLDDER
jgi:multicomponent Na+:H+ antiporter subunit C